MHLVIALPMSFPFPSMAESINMFSTGYTDENGYVALEINADDLGSVTLTVTNHNYIPHLGSFDVSSSTRFVNVFDPESLGTM